MGSFLKETGKLFSAFLDHGSRGEHQLAVYFFDGAGHFDTFGGAFAEELTMLHVSGEGVGADLIVLLVFNLKDVGACVHFAEFALTAHGGASEFNFFGFSGV